MLFRSAPPVGAWVRRRLDPRRNPFLRSAELELYGAWRGNELVGTISALRDHAHEAHRKESVAFFGFFECRDDPEAARALFDTASARARAWGADLLRGPRNLSRVEEVGLTIEGHDRVSPMLAGHQPARYRALVEGEGFVPHHDVLAYEADLVDGDGPRPLPAHLEAAADAIDLPGLRITTPRWYALGRDLGLAHEVFVEAFRDVPENTPMPRSQFVALGGGLTLLTDPRMLQLGLRLAYLPYPPEVYGKATPDHALGPVVAWAYNIRVSPNVDITPSVGLGAVFGPAATTGENKVLPYIQAGLGMRGRIPTSNGGAVAIGPEIGLVATILAPYVALNVSLIGPRPNPVNRDDW